MTANDQFLDAMIRHQIFLMRLSGGLQKRIIKLLNATEVDMANEIRRRLAQGSGQGLTPANVNRMNRLIKVITAMRVDVWKVAEKEWIDELLELAKAEPAFIAGMTKTVAPVTLVTELPSPQLLRSIVTARPFQGRIMRVWARSLAATDIARIGDAIKIGMVQSETNQQIARRVVGSAALRGRDGVTQITRRNAEAITRTAVNHVANQAKREFFKSNSDLFDKEQYVATLDGVTTAICMSIDGRLFEIGRGPIPPLHFNCRSLRVAVLSASALGNRPMKPVTERMLLREYSAANGLPTVTSRGALPRGSRGKFDIFARGRTRELVGQVPADVNYGTFLRRQPVGFQNDVLGVTKGKLFRNGGLTLDKFVTRIGDELTLAQLAAKHASAFTQAGLDPQDFL